MPLNMREKKKSKPFTPEMKERIKKYADRMVLDAPFKWTPRKEAVLRAYVYDGLSLVAIEKKFKVGRQTLWRWRSRTEWKLKESDLRKEAFELHKRELEGLTGKAIAALDVCVQDDADHKVMLDSAKTILDRVGYPGGVKIEQDIKPTINLYIPDSWGGGQKMVAEKVIEVEAVSDGE